MQKRISIFLKTAIYVALFSTEKLNFQLSTQTETMNIWLFRVKSSSLINVFFYLSVHKLFALLFKFRTSCKLQPKYNNVHDVAFVGDSSIGYFCGGQLLSQQHQPCSPKVHTNTCIQMFTCRLLKALV